MKRGLCQVRRSLAKALPFGRADADQDGTPPYAIARGGIVLLGSSTLFPLGVALLIIGLMLEAGATGAVKAIEVSAKLLAGRYPQTPGDQVGLGR